MEESMYMNSHMHQKPVASKPPTEGSSSPDDPEESGWTSYFEDFSNNNKEKEEEKNSHWSSFVSPSLVSDAASSAACKLSNRHDLATTTTKMPKKLKFKKRRTKQICGDDSLEDTASSPVNSPKVSDLEPIDHVIPMKPDDHKYSSLGKGGVSGNYSEQKQTERSMNFNSDCKDLTRRGLCLVPLSMLVNYLG